MNSKNTQFKNASVIALLEEFLSDLSDREKDILVRRFQLSQNPRKETLKQIGDDYGITRERVRQIEKDSINKIKNQIEKSDNFSVLVQEIVNFLNDHGGFAEENYLLSNLLQNLIEQELKEHEQELNKRALYFVIDQLVDDFYKEAENNDFNYIWRLDSTELNLVREYIQEIIASLEQENKTLKTQEFIDYLKSHSAFEQRKDFFEAVNSKSNKDLEDILLSYINLTKNVKQNIFDEWGLVSWSRVQPRKLAEKIDLVLEKQAKPLHFSEIAENINNANFDNKNICAATVHNELISNKNYVLVGRGIYALKEWGYQDGTVLEVIELILNRAEQPMTKEEIFENVLKQRMVRKATIYLALMNKDKFEKLPSGLYKLRA